MNGTMVTGIGDGVETPPILDDFWTLLILEWRRNGLAAPIGFAVDRFEKTNATVTFASSVELVTWAKHFSVPTRTVDLPKGAGWLTWTAVDFHGYNVTLEFCLRTADILPEDAPVTDAEITGLVSYLPPQWISVASGEPVDSQFEPYVVEVDTCNCPIWKTGPADRDTSTIHDADCMMNLAAEVSA